MSSNHFLLAQIFAFLSSLCLLFSFWQKRRKRILFFQMLDSCFDIIQYFLLGAYTGSIISFLGSVRAIIFLKKDEKFYLYLFLILYFIFSVITYNGIISLFPMCAALMYTVVIWNRKEKNIRLFSIFVFLLWFVYDVLMRAYVSCITDAILVLSNLLAYCKIDEKL